MAKKTLESNSKRKPELEVVQLTGDEVLSSITNKKKKIDPTGSIQIAKQSKKPQDSTLKPGESKNKEKKSKKTQGSTRKLDDSKKKAVKTEKKVKLESPVKRSGKKDQVDVKKVKKSKVKKEEGVDGNESGALYAFPMNRVTRIVKSENSDIKLSAEAAFLFNKASERFLELFSKEAYACAFKDGKKKIEYQHLSSLIPGNKRFDFLSDFVPAKVKVADALKEIPSVET